MTTQSLCHTKVLVTKENLPVKCPPNGTPTYNSHPLQYLDITKTGEAKCPYCSTHYILEGEEPLAKEMYDMDEHVVRNEKQTQIGY